MNSLLSIVVIILYVVGFYNAWQKTTSMDMPIRILSCLGLSIFYAAGSVIKGVLYMLSLFSM